MSIWSAGLVSPGTGAACDDDVVPRVASTELPVRRVRQEVRDGVAAACFSAAASVALALTLMLIVSLLGQHA